MSFLIRYPLSVIRYPLSVIRYPILNPQSSILNPQTTDQLQNRATNGNIGISPE
jgi:hypothetical protein